MPNKQKPWDNVVNSIISAGNSQWMVWGSFQWRLIVDCVVNLHEDACYWELSSGSHSGHVHGRKCLSLPSPGAWSAASISNLAVKWGHVISSGQWSGVEVKDVTSGWGSKWTLCHYVVLLLPVASTKEAAQQGGICSLPAVWRCPRERDSWASSWICFGEKCSFVVLSHSDFGVVIIAKSVYLTNLLCTLLLIYLQPGPVWLSVFSALAPSSRHWWMPATALAVHSALGLLNHS